MMKKLILLTFIVGLFALPLHAQEKSSQATIEDVITNETGALQAPVELTDYFSKNLFKNAKQLAVDANSVAIVNTVGDGNITRIKQIGKNNIGVIKTRGNNNKAELTQNGSNLLSLIGVQGFSNDLIVEQVGNGLGNKILLEGTDIDFNILQNTNGIFIRMAHTSIPLKITQTGTVPIKISNN